MKKKLILAAAELAGAASAIENFMKKKLISFILLWLIFPIFNSQFSVLNCQVPLRSVDLTKEKPSWQAVIGGEAVSPCIETSYGIAVVSDGRLLSACTNNGNVIWQRSIKGRPSRYLSSLGDFLYLVTDSSKLNFINPSGATVWQAECPFEITSAPLPGKDGRVFVRGKDSIACFGLDGKRKWIKKTDALSSDFPVSQLKDGSVLVYLAREKDGHTIGKRFSAFGEPLEDLTFAGIVSYAENVDDGILVSLSNGLIGLVTAQENGKADSKWVVSSGNSLGAFSIAYRPQTRHAAYFFQKGSTTEALIVNVSDGTELGRFPVGNINLSGFKGSKSSTSGFFISGSYSACEFYEDGTILWSAVLPSSKNWKELCYTRANYLIFCFNDWSMNSYKMNSIPGDSFESNKISVESLIKTKEFDSVTRNFGLHSLTTEKMAEISAALKSEDSEENEKDYLSEIKSEAENYIGTLNSISARSSVQNFYEENPSYTRNLMYLMSICGTADFSSIFANILKSETDTNLLSAAIVCSGDEGFDPDGEILSSYEYLISNSLSVKDARLLSDICDSTYKVCRFMGRPAFNRQGKNILSRLMFPQYDKSTRDYARKTLEKMIGLEK